jgi:type I restriction enzyme R subunit
MNKKQLSERDICTKFITPALVAVGWNIDTQVREEVGFTDGRIYVRGKIHARGAQKRADYILYYKPNIPIAIVEAKDNHHSVSWLLLRLRFFPVLKISAFLNRMMVVRAAAPRRS